MEVYRETEVEAVGSWAAGPFLVMRRGSATWVGGGAMRNNREPLRRLGRIDEQFVRGWRQGHNYAL